MAPLRIAVSLGNVPQMLRTIVLKTLESVADAAMVDYVPDDPDGYDVLILSNRGPAEDFLRRGRIGRVIDIEPEGRQASIHWLNRSSRRVIDLSPERLLALVTKPLPNEGVITSDSKGRSWVSNWLLRSRRRALPPPGRAQLEAPDMHPIPEETASEAIAGPPANEDPIVGELARVAGRIVAARPRMADGAPADALLALARRLAARGGRSPGLPELERIRSLFGLTDDERDLLFLSAVVEIEPQAARLVSLLNDHPARSRPTVALVEAFGGDPRAVGERLARNGPLTAFGLVRVEGSGPLPTRTVAVDAGVWPLLFGMERVAPFPVETLGDEDLDRLPLAEEQRAAIVRTRDALLRKGDDRSGVAVVGDQEVGQGAIARAIAGRLRRRAVIVGGAAVQDLDSIAALSREALLMEAAVILSEPETCPPAMWRALTETLPAPLLVITDQGRLGPLALASARPLTVVAAPLRDRAQRLRIWAAQAPADWPPEALHELADRFGFGTLQVSSALSLARTRALSDGRPRPEPGDARAAGEMLRDTHFGGAAERLDCPYRSDEIVLSPETRRELDLAVAWARHGGRLFCDGGPAAALRAGGGLACLFTGPPGTGKTMAAQIVARQIDYALFRIDLSQVIDKYIGESEKRLSAVFEEAERSRVALFFDEADALFGKRTEVRDSHDRYANIAVDHLLQKLDGFQGLAILATNLAGNIDTAFLRRIRIRAEFQPPGVLDRRRIWAKLLPDEAVRAPDIDIPRLADPFELVGGEIRNAIYTAHLLAAEQGEALAMTHCVAGLARELGKTGRISDLAPLDPWRSAPPLGNAPVEAGSTAGQ